MMQIAEHFYTMTEAAEMLRVDRVTIRRWIQSGKLAAQRVGRVVFIEKRHVDAIKDAQLSKETVNAKQQ